VILGLWLACARDRAEIVADSALIDVTCPPAEPTGSAEGERAADVFVQTCDGAVASLHGLCGAPALVVNWYGWCPSCEDNAALARQLAQAHPALRVAITLTEDPLAEPVDADFCASYQDYYPSPAVVWMDPDRALEAYGSTDLVLVLDADGTLELARQTSNEEVITAAVAAALGG